MLMEQLTYPFSITWTLSDKHKYQIVKDIISGVEYLHKRNIIHADLKSPNIMLNQQYRAKITDFGVSKIKTTLKSTVAGPGNAGTVRWQAPELGDDNVKTSKMTDIYSLGTVLWEVYSGEIPYAKLTDDIKVVWARARGATLTIPLNVPIILREIILSCWKEPEQRPQVSDILKVLQEQCSTEK